MKYGCKSVIAIDAGRGAGAAANAADRGRLPRAGRLGSRLPARALCGAKSTMARAVHRSGRGLDRMGAGACRVGPALQWTAANAGQAQLAADVATPAIVALGQTLFFDARLSRKAGILCVLPCARTRLHRRQAAGGGRGRLMGRRRSTPLYAAPFAPRLFWDGRAATLKEQVMGPLHDPREMNHDAAGAVARLDASESYPARFLRAFGAAPAQGSPPGAVPMSSVPNPPLDAISVAPVPALRSMPTGWRARWPPTSPPCALNAHASTTSSKAAPMRWTTPSCSACTCSAPGPAA